MTTTAIKNKKKKIKKKISKLLKMERKKNCAT